MKTRTTSRRPMTSQRVAATLSAAFVPALGPNLLNKIGRGNNFVREDSTIVTIFNLQAFKSLDDKKAAQAFWLTGHKIEKSGDIAGAQEHYKNALNKLMSFSVLAENAPDYASSYQITCQVVEVPSRESEDVLVLGINQARPVAVTANTVADNVTFEEPAETEETAPETTSATTTGRAAGKGKNAIKA